jgi:hypothetical protein
MFMFWIFPVSGGLALLLSGVTFVLSQRNSTPDRLVNHWAIATAVAWAVTSLEVCTFVILLYNYGYGL